MGISNVRGVFSACLSYDWAMFDGLMSGIVILWWLSSCAAARGSIGGYEVLFPSPVCWWRSGKIYEYGWLV